MKTKRTPVVVGIGDKQPIALRFALREAHRRGAELRVVHSAGLPVDAAAAYAGTQIFEELREAGQKVLDDAKHFIQQEVTPVKVSYVLTTVAQSLEATTTAAAPSPALPYGFVLELRDQLGPGFDDYLASLWTSAERLRSDDVDDQVLATAEVVAEAADVDASHAFGQMSR